MFQGFLVGTILFGGKLAGALVELRGHLGGFFLRTTERDENLGELGNVHAKSLSRKTKTQEAENILPASCAANSV